MEPQSPVPITTVRRNPPRKAKQTPSINVLDSSTSSTLPKITPFTLNEILTKPTNGSEPENLKVFLRIRPLEIRPKTAKNSKAKPLKPKGKTVIEKNSKINNVCLVVNDSSSVTLSPPASVFDNNKRSKCELYDGFSFVFPQDAAQENVYEKAMNPLLMDFIGGKSALLAAMGPTGSGKTHTMFGTARDPGIVPLALRRIFSYEMESENHNTSRSYYLSMFEIYSERGKGEKIFDLSCDGGDLSFQQSSIKGLQEIRISDANEAEGLVARGLLKRATAATSANNQSSRSQCIINIRCNVEDRNKDGLSPHNAVLTIADLAGAERERKTGNQGARLLESNSINNTSMVFGLCLRSLLEHQKNSKKSFEKHFKNSLLTRYLREYLEGKKRMTLILTVKPGEHDYLDTSFLLRQASPYMKIKFSNVEEVPSSHRQKRNTTSLLRAEDHKRRKIDLEKTNNDVPSGPNKELQIVDELLEIEAQHISSMSSKFTKISHVEAKLNRELQAELVVMKRNDEVMRKFSKALWGVLKQYKNKLEESENEVRNLKETLGKEIKQVAELKDELEELKSHRSCYKIPSTDQICVPRMDASNLNPKSSELSTMTINESEVLGLKGIIFDADIAGKSKNIYCSMERHSLVLERQKISAFDVVQSSFPSGSPESQNNHQITEGLLEKKRLHNCLESLSNSTAHVPFELDLAESADENVNSSPMLNSTAKDCPLVGEHTSLKDDKEMAENLPEVEQLLNHLDSESLSSYSVNFLSELDPSGVTNEDVTRFPVLNDTTKNCSLAEEYTLSKENNELVTSDAEGTNRDTDDFNDPRYECSEGLIMGDSNRVSEISCSGTSRDVQIVNPLLSVDDTTTQNFEKEETLQELELKSEDMEGTFDEQSESLKNENLLGVSSYPLVTYTNSHDEVEVGSARASKRESDSKEAKPELDVSPFEGNKENDRSQIIAHSENTKHDPSTKSLKAVKPKRKLLPASTLLLKEFSGLDMEAENTKENMSKPTTMERGRSRGSISLVSLLTSKK